MSRTGAKGPCCAAIMTMADIRLEGRAGQRCEVLTAVVVDGPRGKEYRLPTYHERTVAEVTEEQLRAAYTEIPFGLPEEPISPDRPSPNSRAGDRDRRLLGAHQHRGGHRAGGEAGGRDADQAGARRRRRWRRLAACRWHRRATWPRIGGSRPCDAITVQPRLLRHDQVILRVAVQPLDPGVSGIAHILPVATLSANGQSRSSSGMRSVRWKSTSQVASVWTSGNRNAAESATACRALSRVNRAVG